MRFIILLLLIPFVASAQYEIKGTIESYDQDSIYLGYFFADKQYILDTAYTDEQGSFTFKGDDTLKSGVYLVVMPPDNAFFQILIDEDAPKFSFKSKMSNIEDNMEFENSDDNSLFYQHLNYLSAKRSILQGYQAVLGDSTKTDDHANAQSEIDRLNADVRSFQQNLIEEHPEKLTTVLIKTGLFPDIPEFEGSEEEIQMQKYRYYKEHYFDNLDLGDDRLIRAPRSVMYDRVFYYLEKLTPQHPDSISVSINYLLDKMEPADQTFRYFLVNLYNRYVNSKFVGMDAVYVNIANRYFATGKAPWMDKEELNKILSEVRLTEPTLIGKIAPDFTVQTKDSSDINLYGLDSDYTVLIFWAHDCPHCKKTMPDVPELQDKFKDRGVTFFTVCTKSGSNEPPCWEFVEENELEGILNASDKTGGKSGIMYKYNLKTTPRIFVLDKQKKIISKNIGTEQIEEVLNQIMKQESKS